MTKIHCLFEQSGTFRDVFRKLGYESYDYDISNEFQKTDFKVDLFTEIERGFIGNKSIFDKFGQDDLIIAFFPCTLFSGQNELFFSGKSHSFRKMDVEDIKSFIRKRKLQRAESFELLEKMVSICENRNFKLIIENPYHLSWLLTQKNWKSPNLIIQDRTLMGDYYIKPTMFYFINIQPTTWPTDFIAQFNKKSKGITETTNKIERSLMHPTFAYNFVQKYIFGI